jgi:hypothetical protein
MVGTNLDARSLYIPRLGSPAPLRSSFFISLSLQRHHVSAVSQVSRQLEFLIAMTSSSRYNLALLSSSIEFLEVVSTTPLAAMDPKTSTRRGTASQGSGSSTGS